VRQPSDPDAELLDRFRTGDEHAFVELVSRHHTAMLRFAATFVSSPHLAEEVTQDTWLAALRGIDAFERRAAFRTWLFAILANRARTTGMREKRTTSLDAPEPAVDPSRFDANGMWASPPADWTEAAEERLDARSLAPTLQSALDGLPPRQRQVVLLRDVDGLTPDEVCSVLAITDANQRVLLHRGRSHLRATLEAAFGTP
jgi:RNA polymerase sigma-70 factor (ECF subfamily)